MMHWIDNIHVKYKAIYLHSIDDDGADKGMRDVMKTFTFWRKGRVLEAFPTSPWGYAFLYLELLTIGKLLQSLWISDILEWNVAFDVTFSFFSTYLDYINKQLVS